MANNAWITSGNDLQKELEMRRIMSDYHKQNQVKTLAGERGIVLQEKTNEFLENYFFRKETTIKTTAETIIIHTQDGAWSDEVCIRLDGSFTYCGGINCLW